MNLSQLRKLKNGDEVVYVGPAFTQGKLYKVKETSVGRLIYDDNGVGRFLHTIESNFDIKERRKANG